MPKTKELKKCWGACRERIFTSVFEAGSGSPFSAEHPYQNLDRRPGTFHYTEREKGVRLACMKRCVSKKAVSYTCFP
jgi:hypothetical protein